MGTAAINRWIQGILLEAQAAMCRCRYCSMDNSDLLERVSSDRASHTRAVPWQGTHWAPARGKCSHTGVWFQVGAGWALYSLRSLGHTQHWPWGSRAVLATPRKGSELAERERLHQTCHGMLLSSRKYCFITGNPSVSLLLIKMWEKFLTSDLHLVLSQEKRLPSVIKVFPDGTLNWQFW